MEHKKEFTVALGIFTVRKASIWLIFVDCFNFMEKIPV